MKRVKNIKAAIISVPMSAILLCGLIAPAAFAANDWGSFTETSTGSQSSKEWYSTSSSFTGKYQAAVADENDIYVSNDYGQTWTDEYSGSSVNTEWTSISVSSTGQYQTAVAYIGTVYISSDYGQTWTASSGAPSNQLWESVALSSTGKYQTGVVDDGDIYVSSDYGQTWTDETSTGIAHSISYDGVNISGNGQYIAAVTDGQGIFVSNDFGQTWTNTATSGPLSSSYTWTSAMSSSGQIIYASIYDGDVYKSTDYGQTWTDITNGTPDLSSQEAYFITTSANGQDVAIAGYEGDVFVSNDSGNSWTNMTTGTSLSDAGIYPIAFSGSGEYLNAAVYGGGLYISQNTTQAPITSDSISNAVNGSPVNISTPLGTTISCDNSVAESGLTVKDTSNYSYPLGLVNLCYSTINSSDQVSLIFVTNLTPSQVVARDFNSQTGIWQTIPGAVVTETTYNGQQALELTYSVTDNGSLDSNSVNGAVTDPVGLAVNNEISSPDTGFGEPNNNNLYISYGSLASLILVGIGLSIGYRYKNGTSSRRD